MCETGPLIVFAVFRAGILRGNRILGNARIYGNSIDSVFWIGRTRSHPTNVVITPIIEVSKRGAEAIFLGILLIFIAQNVKKERDSKKRKEVSI